MSWSAGIRLFFGAILVSLALVALRPVPTLAAGLQIRPLLYKEHLKPGETKKGYVEVSNVSHVAVKLLLHVKSFRQTDAEGNLQFTDSAAIQEGVRLDLDEVDLGPREAIRVYFLVDSAKLPPGDVFASIFAATQEESDAGIVPSAQVGTLLILENGSSGPRKAEVRNLHVPLFQTADFVRGRADVRNVAPVNSSTAFFPDMKVTIGPLWDGSRRFEGPLVFAGITRKVDFSIPADNRLGIFKLKVSAQGDSEERYVLFVTGFWRWVIPLLLLGTTVIALSVKRLRSVSRRTELLSNQQTIPTSSEDMTAPLADTNTELPASPETVLAEKELPVAPEDAPEEQSPKPIVAVQGEASPEALKAIEAVEAVQPDPPVKTLKTPSARKKPAKTKRRAATKKKPTDSVPGETKAPTKKKTRRKPKTEAKSDV